MWTISKSLLGGRQNANVVTLKSDTNAQVVSLIPLYNPNDQSKIVT